MRREEVEKDCRERRSGNNSNDVGKENSNTVDRNITSRILSFVVVLLQLPSFSFLPNVFSFLLSFFLHSPTFPIQISQLVSCIIIHFLPISNIISLSLWCATLFSQSFFFLFYKPLNYFSLFFLFICLFLESYLVFSFTSGSSSNRSSTSCDEMSLSLLFPNGVCMRVWEWKEVHREWKKKKRNSSFFQQQQQWWRQHQQLWPPPLFFLLRQLHWFDLLLFLVLLSYCNNNTKE